MLAGAISSAQRRGEVLDSPLAVQDLRDHVREGLRLDLALLLEVEEV
jgi:hypothetical protein